MESPTEYSAQSEHIFLQPEVFEPAYVPETVHFRDEQLGVLADGICGGGGPVSHMVLWGPKGTGKTACVRHLFAKIAGDAHAGVLPVYLNVQNEGTRVAMVGAIYAAVTGTDLHLQSQSFARAHHRLGQLLQEEKRTLVVCLDDGDWLLSGSKKPTILSDLLNIEENFPGAKVCVLVVVSSAPAEAVSAYENSVLMTFSPEVVYFPPYSPEDLVGILGQYAGEGLFADVAPVPVLERIAAHSTSEGYARKSIAMLRDSARLAMRSGRGEITDEDVISVCHSLRMLGDNPFGAMVDTKSKQILADISRSTVAGKEVIAGDVYRVAEEVTGLKQTAVYSRLKKLEKLGFIRLEPVNRGRWGKTTRIVMLTNPAGLVDEDW